MGNAFEVNGPVVGHSPSESTHKTVHPSDVHATGPPCALQTAFRGYPQVAAMLAMDDSKLDISSSVGLTPMVAAAESGSVVVVRLLLQVCVRACVHACVHVCVTRVCGCPQVW